MKIDLNVPFSQFTRCNIYSQTCFFFLQGGGCSETSHSLNVYEEIFFV